MISSGIWFNNTHSYNDLNLILVDAKIAPATVQTKYVEIPGSDEPLDLTECYGEVKYSSRECKFTFVVHTNDKMSFEEKKTKVCNLLNGKVCKIILDVDSEYYYYGRIAVDSYAQKGNLKQIEISAKANPYKLKKEETKINAVISSQREVICSNLYKSVVPTITATADFTIEFNGNSYAISAGENIIVPDIKFVAGDNILKCTGTGTITFTYQEGSL